MFVGYVLGVCWICVGYVLGMCWVCVGYVLGVSWVFALSVCYYDVSVMCNCVWCI